jgi:uncharacterized membrane protein YbaN (DUF454 family)
MQTRASGADMPGSQWRRPYIGYDTPILAVGRTAVLDRIAAAVEGSRRLLWRIAGGLALALALAGIVLPLVPTTPFLLLAAWCLARGSRRWHDWLISHPRFGPPIRQWSDHRAISRTGKMLAGVGMPGAVAVTAAFGATADILLIQAGVMGLVALFIFTRPSPPGA